MDRRARLRLIRLSPPFSRTVEIRRITIGGFLELVRFMAPRAAQAVLASKEPLTDAGLIRACADAESLAAFADLVAVDQPVGFLRGYMHGRLGGFFARRNTDALLAACRAVEGEGQWTRFIGCLNRGVETKGNRRPKRQGGGLMADVMTLSGIMGLDPMLILRWDMQEFLNLCEALNMLERQQGISDPLSDPD